MTNEIDNYTIFIYAYGYVGIRRITYKIKGSDKLYNLLDFFKLMSDETRLRILILLSHKKFCVCELCGIMKESQPKISKHLGKMRDIGLVKDERQEQFIYYRLNITDKLYMNILNEIIQNADDYPIIKEDLLRSKDTKAFLDSCKR